MALLTIRQYGDPVLRQTAEEVTNINGTLARLAADMLATMKSAKGVGLAANQVGSLARLYVVDTSPFLLNGGTLVLINPRVVETKGEETAEEGCLSIPGIYEDIIRPQSATVEGLDLDGKTVTYEGKGMVARVFLHELDHLNGVLFIDHLSPAKRELLKSRLREIKEKHWAL